MHATAAATAALQLLRRPLARVDLTAHGIYPEHVPRCHARHTWPIMGRIAAAGRGAYRWPGSGSRASREPVENGS
jgi:hypothetical protein